MPRAERNRLLFASAIAGSGSTTSRRTRPVAGTHPTAPVVIDEESATRTDRTDRLLEKMDSLDKKMDFILKEQIEIKKRLKNIELLSEINNDPDFSKVSIF
jgi:hypothetical protein